MRRLSSCPVAGLLLDGHGLGEADLDVSLLLDRVHLKEEEEEFVRRGRKVWYGRWVVRLKTRICKG